MFCAVFSDIHANLEALEAAVAHAEGRGIRQWMVLGDSVGYGANPNECLEWVLRHADCMVTGNHEAALLDPRIREWFNPAARTALEWTSGVLDAALRERLRGIPYVTAAGDAVFVHGSLDEPEAFRYLFSFEDTAGTFAAMKTTVCFAGHTHLPGCFCENERVGRRLLPGVLTLQAGARYILNPGSVGQPRDGDPRLSYALYDSVQRTFEIVRLPYDNVKAADKIRRAGLPRFLADRLL